MKDIAKKHQSKLEKYWVSMQDSFVLKKVNKMIKL